VDIQTAAFPASSEVHSSTSIFSSDFQSTQWNQNPIPSFIHAANLLLLDRLNGDGVNILSSAFDEKATENVSKILNEYRFSGREIDDFLNFRVIPVDSISGLHTGAYDSLSNTIYLSNDFIQNASFDDITGVLLEEIGHALDKVANPVDSLGDEGEVFAHIVLHGNTDALTPATFDEDDSGTLLIGSDEVSVEFNDSITVFEHANFSGRSKSFGIGNYSYIGNDFNDILTSIRIPPGRNIVVEAFEHANFQGRSTVLSYSQASIGADWNDPNWRVSHMNDTVSSLRVRRQRSDEVILYQHGNFQGLAHSETIGNKPTVRFNEDYSSIDLPANTRIDVFEHTQYRGRMTSFGSDVRFLGVLNDRVSSFQAYRVNNMKESLSSLVERLALTNPSALRFGVQVFAFVTNNKIVNSLSKAGTQGFTMLKAFQQYKNDDPVNSVMTILDGTQIFPAVTALLPRYREDALRAFNAITGRNINGYDIRDLLAP
jgi:hypothetical protein